MIVDVDRSVGDDATAIQAAVDAAREACGPMTHGAALGGLSKFGAAVRIPEGRYVVRRPIRLPAGLHIFCDSLGSAVLRHEAADECDLFATDPAYPSRGDGHWFNSFENLILYGDYTHPAKTFRSRRAIDASTMQRSHVRNCHIEAFQVGWYAKGQNYYSRIEASYFINNGRHVEQRGMEPGGGCQPLTLRDCSLFVSSGMINAGPGRYPTEAILSERPLRLADNAIESSNYFRDGDVRNYRQIRSNSGVAESGRYMEGAEYWYDVSLATEVRHLHLASVSGHTYSPRIMYLRDVEPSEAGSKLAWTNQVRHPWDNWRQTGLVCNPFMREGVAGYGAVEEAPGGFIGFDRCGRYTASDTNKLKPVARYVIPREQLLPWRGQRLFFGGLIERDIDGWPCWSEGQRNSQSLQVQDRTATPYRATTAPTIGYDNGWELWVVQYPIPAEASQVEDVSVFFRLSAPEAGASIRVQGFDCWAGGFPTIPFPREV